VGLCFVAVIVVVRQFIVLNQMHATISRQQVIDCGFSPDGSKIVSCSNDETVRVWNASTGKLIHTMKGHTDSVSEKKRGVIMRSNLLFFWLVFVFVCFYIFNIPSADGRITKVSQPKIEENFNVQRLKKKKKDSVANAKYKNIHRNSILCELVSSAVLVDAVNSILVLFNIRT
jgi:WD40 repeat protein